MGMQWDILLSLRKENMSDICYQMLQCEGTLGGLDAK